MGVVRPSGPLPGNVYWRRRLVVLGIPVVVLVLIVWSVAGRGNGASAASGTPSGSATDGTHSSAAKAGSGATGGASSVAARSGDAKGGSGSKTPPSAGSPASAPPQPTDAPKPGGGVADCAPTDLTLTIAATAPKFTGGATPTFRATIVNSGSKPCLVDAGAAHEEITVASGSDRVWSSLDCAKPDASRVLLLPGAGKDAQNVAWNLARSERGCPSGLPAPKHGTYTVSFTVGGAQAVPASFVLR